MLACCHVTKSTQLIEEEGLIRWEIAIIKTDKFTFLLLEFQQWKKQWEAIQAVVLRSMGKSRWSVYHTLSGTIIATLEHLNQRALSKNYKYIHWKLYTQNACYKWTWVAHKDNQVDGKKNTTVWKQSCTVYFCHFCQK